MTKPAPTPIALAAMLTILSCAAESRAQDATSDSATVRVEGQRQNYRSLSVTGATKTDALLIDLPQSVRVLTADLLSDAGVRTLSGALDLTSGISRQSNLGGLWDSYAMRGFTGDPNFGSDYMVNGFNSSRGYNGVRGSANTDSIEVLKGPASALYGRGEPGGTVNIVTKKPRFTPGYEADLSAGSFDTYRAAVDLTGPLSDNVAYRLNAAHEKGDSFRDVITVERTLLAPSFIWLIGDATTLSYEIEASEQKTPFDRGIPAIDGVLGRVPVSRFLGEPGDGEITVKSVGQQLFLRHEFDAGWSLQAGLSYRDSSLSGFSSEVNNILADGRTARRQHRYRDWAATDASGRVEIVGKLRTGTLAHHVLAGADFYRFNDARILLRRNPSAGNGYLIDVFNPVYGGTADPLALSTSTRERQRARGLYVQDQIDLSARWKALVGLRHDSYEQTVENRRTALSNSQSLSETSPRIGIVYQPMPNLALYANAARGFRPNSGISLENTAFPAERSRSYEVGVKVDSAGGRLSSTVALYKIDKTNVLTTNPVNTDYSISAGEVGSKGLEVDVSGEIVANLRLSAAYAYTDATVTKGDNTIVTGSRFPNVPRQSANVILTRRFALGGGMATLGGGLNHVGERLGNVAASSKFTLPSYTTARLIASYAPNAKVRISLNIDNLFDKTYYASSYSEVWVNPGTERVATLGLHYKF
ncbi:TonB-dependent siderophore receptor [Massilia sp. G4R7]|uniref:TonB-dependent siderophore receptor n=1 Tax=Massilia phyllostachyos TaxID=2898585 RepID=A0ABS8Q3P2_9BURK|nr:TonB-dependent siderophore receptor [Massilia phyllostachyos]MCD2516366.1 TonB-dependent siderophore receptor [Massilia phyllostachyos]